MTVVHPNHIVGINSITVQTGDSLSVHKADGSLIRTIVSNTGVSTFHAVEVSKGGGDLTVGVSTFFVDNSTGRIGIGTVAPARDMVHIHNPAANASSYIQFTNANTAGTGINDGTLIGISQNNSNTDGTGSGFTILQKENAEITLGTNNTERLRIKSDGKTFIHATDATGANNTSTLLSNGNTLNIHGTSSVDGISVVRYSADYGAYGINIGKSNNSTFGTNTLVTSGEELGHITFYGADGTNFETAAQITGLVDINGAPTDGTDMPGALSFRTSPDGSATPSERLKIDCRGFIGINESNPDKQLHLSANNNGVSANAFTSANNTIRFTDTDTDVTSNQPGGTIEWETLDSTAAGVNAYIATKNSNTGYASMHFGTGNQSTLAERFSIDQSGNIAPGADGTQDLGSTSKRWANIYSADLQLSNEGSENEIDGSWGSYTIQEGEADLFLINRRNGKKYTFNLTEVS